MNIAFDCERMKYPYTGLFEYCLQLGLSLREETSAQDQISYYLRQGDQRYFNQHSKFLFRKIFHKLSFPNYKDTDLWHITHQTSVYVPQSPKIKKVVTIHDLNFLYENKSPWKQKEYLKQHQRNIDRSDHIIAISNYTKNDIVEHLNTRDKPVSVIYNGCNALPIGAVPAYQPQRPFLLALGTVNAKKNFHVLVPLLKDNDQELIIAGRIDTAYKQIIDSAAAFHGVAERVKIIGTVSDQEKSWYYQHCEAFLFPSLAEGFGIPPIEAMRFGKPVFLSDSTSLPEIGGSVAYYFNNFDPDDMRRVYQQGMNDYNHKKPSSAIINHALQFDWSASAKAYWKIYRSILKP